MTFESHQSDLRWYHFSRVKLTREYVGGLLGGFGLGCIVMVYLVNKQIVGADLALPVEVLMPGFLLIAIGSTIGFNAQRRRKTDSS